MEVANNSAGAINLHAAQNVLRPCYTSVVRRVPRIAQMHVSADPATAGASLGARATSPGVATLPAPGLRVVEGTPGGQRRTTRRCKSLGLRLEVPVVFCVQLEDFIEYG